MPPKDGHQGKTVVVSCMNLMHAITTAINTSYPVIRMFFLTLFGDYMAQSHFMVSLTMYHCSLFVTSLVATPR